jgi:hypothetical protein
MRLSAFLSYGNFKRCPKLTAGAFPTLIEKDFILYKSDLYNKKREALHQLKSLPLTM